jgi:hypothetical protein
LFGFLSANLGLSGASTAKSVGKSLFFSRKVIHRGFRSGSSRLARAVLYVKSLATDDPKQDIPGSSKEHGNEGKNERKVGNQDRDSRGWYGRNLHGCDFSAGVGC